MKRSIAYVAFALLVGAALAACGNGNRLIGTWKIDNGGAANPTPTGTLAQQRISGVTIEFKSDNTFTLSSMGGSEQGTWKVDGGKVTLSVAGNMGNTLSSTGTMSDDGKALTISPPGLNLGLSFVKQGS